MFVLKLKNVKLKALIRAACRAGDSSQDDVDGEKGGEKAKGKECPYIGWSADKTNHMLDAQVLPIPPHFID